MYCSRCKAAIAPGYKYCPECGEKIESADSNPSKPVSMKKKKMPFWFKAMTFVTVLALIGVTGAILFTEKLVDVVDYQLEALRNGNIEKAYSAYTSSEFRETTSLDRFQNFVTAYPAFEKNLSAHFSQRSFDRHIAVLKGYLSSVDHIDTPIEYRLVRENNKWKILSIRLPKPEAIPDSPEANVLEDLVDVAKNQLNALKQGQIAEAYSDYSSKEFKEATSEDAFREFINHYSVLMEDPVFTFHKPMIRNGIGTLSAIAKSNKKTVHVKYYFVYEDRKWKIWSVRIFSPAKSKSESKSL